MRTVWITPGFASDEKDTSCIPTLQDLALALKKRAEEIIIVALDYPFRKEEYYWNGIKVYSFGNSNKGLVYKLKLLRDVWSLLRKLNQEKKIDVVHSFWLTWPAIAGQHFCKQNSLPHIQTIMGRDAMNNRFHRWFDFNFSTIVNLSEFSNNVFYNSTGRKANVVIPFGTAKFSTSNNSKDVDLINVGSVTRLKNQFDFLKIVKDVQQKKPDVKAVLIGNFFDRNLVHELNKYINRFSLNENILFLNEMPREDVFNWMSRSKIMVHTSLYESQGMVMQEAIAHGCKVYSTGNGIQFKHSMFQLFSIEDKTISELLYRDLVKVNQSSGHVLIGIEETANAYFNLYNLNQKIR